MAAIAGSIATGQVVSPFLAREEGTVDEAPPLYEVGSLGQEHLETLRFAAHSVVNNPEGTAYATFHETIKEASQIARYVFGKTGTATLEGHGIPKDKKDVQGSWFVGWMTKFGGKRADRPLIAFSCGISHITEGGSAICAGLMAAILLDLRPSLL